MSERDKILEEVACLVEQGSFADLAGIMARKKRVREDAELRLKTIEEMRQRIAETIRRQKGSRTNDPEAILQDISQLGQEHDHVLFVRHAEPLARLGLVDIRLELSISANSVPPPTRYKIVLTDAGRERLKARAA